MDADDHHDPDPPDPKDDEDQHEPDDPGPQEFGEQPAQSVRGKTYCIN